MVFKCLLVNYKGWVIAIVICVTFVFIGKILSLEFQIPSYFIFFLKYIYFTNYNDLKIYISWLLIYIGHSCWLLVDHFTHRLNPRKLRNGREMKCWWWWWWLQRLSFPNMEEGCRSTRVSSMNLLCRTWILN